MLNHKFSHWFNMCVTCRNKNGYINGLYWNLFGDRIRCINRFYFQKYYMFVILKGCIITVALKYAVGCAVAFKKAHCYLQPLFNSILLIHAHLYCSRCPFSQNTTYLFFLHPILNHLNHCDCVSEEIISNVIH